MNDPEFSREMRFFDGTIGVSIGSKNSLLSFSDGKLVEAVSRSFEDEDVSIFVRGDEADWSELLRPYPRPFFQCLQTAVVKHDLKMSSTHQSFAYLPALNRLVSLLWTGQSFVANSEP
ncbi:hypothetical protein [Solimonas marina]|uniref:Uncharacterized protein n=1 Tax=Solimonas marina TaxID=2714601 RepID=A0A969WEH8_9GAMM|nr:hypothetical protein [Solimonas marina]NKF24769.1 hypothetical protein [Solimonas marina]